MLQISFFIISLFIYTIFIHKQFKVFKYNTKYGKFNHEPKSFQQGIEFNFMGYISLYTLYITYTIIEKDTYIEIITIKFFYILLIIILLFFYRFKTKDNIRYILDADIGMVIGITISLCSSNESFKNYLLGNILICLMIFFISTVYILLSIYTITEVKHLYENKNKLYNQKFIKHYVLNGILTFLFEIKILTLICKSMSLPKQYLYDIIILNVSIIILIFLLGMLDLLNAYEEHKFIFIQVIKNLSKYKDEKDYRKECNQSFITNLKNIFYGFKMLFKRNKKQF